MSNERPARWLRTRWLRTPVPQPPSLSAWFALVICGAIASSVVAGHTHSARASVAQATQVAETAAAMRGFWEQARCQVQAREGRRTGARSAFAIFDREWGISFTQYEDPDCRTRVLTAVLRGTYEPTAASAHVPGAVEVTFRFSHKSLTVFDPALVDRLNSGLCGARRWELGVPQDITSTGCLSIESVAACPQEYDLASVDGETLSLGERPEPGRNICAEDRRPRRLRTDPLRRR
jgi:hypothetical protein